MSNYSANQTPDSNVSTFLVNITWGMHPVLAPLNASDRFVYVSEVVTRAQNACGVTDYMQVIPAGWNNGVAGPLREKRGPKGTKHAYYPVSEMMTHWGRVTSGAAYDYRDISAALYEAEKVLEYFA